MGPLAFFRVPLATLAFVAAGHLPAPAPLVGQDAPRVRPDVVGLGRSGDRVEVLLLGRALEDYTAAQVVERSGRPASGFDVQLGPARGGERPVTLMHTGAAAGRYALQLVRGRTALAVALEVHVAAVESTTPTLTPPGAADLAVAVFDGPASVGVGQSFGSDVTLRIRNVGTASVPAGSQISIGFFLSTDPEISTADRLLAGGRENLAGLLTSPLPPGGDVTVPLNALAHVSPTFPDGDPPIGPVYFGVVVDEMNALTEEKGNNVAARPITIMPAGVDLAVSALIVPAELALGQPFGHEVTLRIRNEGNIPVPAGSDVSVGFYLSPDPIITPADRLLAGGRENLASRLSSPLAPGAEVIVPLNPMANVSTTFPDANPPLGAAWLGVVVDEADGLLELDEDNNTAMHPVQVERPGVDLVVAAFEAPTTLRVGEAFGDRVLLRVRNDGNQPVPAGADVSIGFYVSLDPSITTSDRLLAGGRENLASRLSAPLAPGAEVVVLLNPLANISATFPDTSPPSGPFHLGVVVDEGNGIEELDESNNTAVLAASVTPGE